MSLEIFEDQIWQMTLGERAAVEGVLAQLQPALAIELGSMEGASLRRIAAHAREVHSFDLSPPSLPMPDNVVLHTGNSHDLLPPLLEELSAENRNVDFVMVDGDHSAEGVRLDVEDLLNSRAIGRTVILLHDTTNEEVRRGIDDVHFDAWPKVRHVELDWIPGQLCAEPELRNELWKGMGLILVDVSEMAYLQGSAYQQQYHPAADLLAQARDLVVARERFPTAPEHVGDLPEAALERIAVLEAELGALRSVRDRAALLETELWAARQRAAALEGELGDARQREDRLEAELVSLRHQYAGSERALENIKASASWRMTEPVRTAKRLVNRRAD